MPNKPTHKLHGRANRANRPTHKRHGRANRLKVGGREAKRPDKAKGRWKGSEKA